MAGDYSKLWVNVRIKVHPLKKDEHGNYKTNHYSAHTLKVYEYPRRIIESRHWLIRYLLAKYQVRFPRHSVDVYWAYFEPMTREKASSRRRLQISSAKGQITKVEGQIQRYLDAMKQDLFFDKDNDEFLNKLKAKLEQKKFNYEQAILLDIEDIV